MTGDRMEPTGGGKASVLQPPKRKGLPGAEYPPLLAAVLAVVCTVAAGLGEWKVLNETVEGLPKVLTLGTIACAFLNFMINPDFPRLRKALGYLPMLLSVVVMYLLISMYIWSTDFTQTGSMVRGMQKTLYQLITIVYTVCMCYLFGSRALDCFFYSMCAVNGLIMLLELPRFGLAESVASVIRCLATLGDDASGYVRRLEIHDITFLFGQFLIYYLCFSTRDGHGSRRRRWVNIGLCLFFMLVGLKRSTFPAVAMICAAVWLVRKLRNTRVWIRTAGVLLFLFCYFYLYMVHSGLFIQIMQEFGIDMKGRDTFWTLARDYYDFSVLWKGLGFEAVDAIVNRWYRMGLINHPYPLHNDILKIYIELGTLGLTGWAGIHYLYYPAWWEKKFGGEYALLYIAMIGYMTVTYLTDNTVFYFWSCTGIRLIPMAYSYRLIRKEKENAWRPPTAEDAVAAIYEIEKEEQMHA